MATDLLPLRRLRRYARALAGSAEAADALLEATLERAALRLHVYADDRASRTGLLSIMHEVYVERRRPEAPPPQPAGRHEFDRVLSALPEPQREVFLLVTLEELSYEEVAKALAIPVGTVMSRLSRAREKLRVRLGG